MTAKHSSFPTKASPSWGQSAIFPTAFGQKNWWYVEQRSTVLLLSHLSRLIISMWTWRFKLGSWTYCISNGSAYKFNRFKNSVRFLALAIKESYEMLEKIQIITISWEATTMKIIKGRNCQQFIVFARVIRAERHNTADTYMTWKLTRLSAKQTSKIKQQF